MTLNNIFFLANSGLFDFDLTFFSQALLFLVLSLSVTKFFLEPISESIKNRNAYIKYNLDKTNILIAVASEKFENCLVLILEEKKELSRQNNLVKNYLKTKIEKDIQRIQIENQKLIHKVKISLLLQNLEKVNVLNKSIDEIAESFFSKKFL